MRDEERSADAIKLRKCILSSSSFLKVSACFWRAEKAAEVEDMLLLLYCLLCNKDRTGQQTLLFLPFQRTNERERERKKGKKEMFVDAAIWCEDGR
jgi:hypothetical protein